MEAIEITVYPFMKCAAPYQELLKLGEECGEVMAEAYSVDAKGPSMTEEDILSICYELGDVIQVAVNTIVLFGKNPNEIMRSTTIKNSNRGYYAE